MFPAGSHGLIVFITISSTTCFIRSPNGSSMVTLFDIEKLVHLAYRDISEKSTMSLSNWALISQQLAIKFGDRFEIM